MIPRVPSMSDDMSGTSDNLPLCQRMGIMAACDNFDYFKSSFHTIIDMFNSPPSTPELEAAFPDLNLSNKVRPTA